MTRQKFSFSRNSRVYIEKNNSTISIRVRWAQQYETCFNLGIKWDTQKWDKDKQKPKLNTVCGEFNYRQIYEIIDVWLNAVNVSFDNFIKATKIPNKEDFRKSVRDVIYPPQEKHVKLEDIYTNFMNTVSKEHTWAKKSHVKYVQLWKDLNAYRPNSLEHIDKEFMLGLKQYYIKKGLANLTIEKRFKTLRTLLRWAKDNGCPVSSGAIDFKVNLRIVPQTITFLNYDELLYFYNFSFSSEKLKKVRDLFCFMSFTSLRYSDMANLKWENVHDGYIECVQIKTCEKVKIPLVSLAMELLNEYGKNGKNGTVFKALSNQKFNDYLKEAAKIAGLNREVTKYNMRGSERECQTYKFYEIISAHVARRTFVCCSLAFGIPPEVVMSCTGHSDYKAMKPYIAVSDETQIKEIGKWNRGVDDMVQSKDSELDAVWESLSPEKREAAMIMLKALTK